MSSTSAHGIVQLIHGGSRSAPASAGAQGISSSSGATWRAATARDIDELVRAHRDAAVRVQAAGLAGVEIHAAHGFLPAQFLSRTQNIRIDACGRGLEGRARFLRELVRSIRDAVGQDLVIGVRLSPEDERHGIDIRETAQVARWLADDGADYIHLSLGDASAMSTTDPACHPLDLVRPNLPSSVPIVVAGGVWTSADAHRAANHGADIVALGQAAIYDPDWPRRAMSDGWTPARPPFTRAGLREVAVTEPFADYLQQNWPGSVSD